MTTAKPPARYGAMVGARAGGFALAELHHHSGPDLIPKSWYRFSEKIMLQQEVKAR
jgi:hypothetical protein